MKRLTKEIELPFDSTYAPRCGAIEMGEEVGMTKMLAYDGICRKLGQLEDIEDELGIEKITVFKALKNGCYVKNKNGEIVEVNGYDRFSLSFDENEQDWVFLIDEDFREEKNPISYYYYPKDYGKTWALTKEELE